MNYLITVAQLKQNTELQSHTHRHAFVNVIYYNLFTFHSMLRETIWYKPIIVDNLSLLRLALLSNKFIIAGSTIPRFSGLCKYFLLLRSFVSSLSVIVLNHVTFSNVNGT